MSKILFKEEQKYLQGRGFLILLPIWIVLLAGFAILHWQHGVNAGLESEEAGLSNDNFYIAFTFISIVAIAQSIVFARMRLISELREDGFYFKYPPLIFRWRSVSTEKIQSYKIREYRPRREFSGHGIPRKRHGLRRRKWGKGYTAYGKTGLQLVLKDGKKILIGTQRPDALKFALDKLLKPTTPQA